MISGVSMVVLDVEDQEKAKDFWVDKLGFELVSDETYGAERWIEVRPPDGAPRLALTARPPGESRPEVRAELPHSNVFFTCEDINRTYEELTARGVSFPAPPAQMHFGMWALFEDHEGTRFAISPTATDTGAAAR